MISLFWGFLLVPLAQYSVQETAWCDPKYQCNGEIHTMCKYKMEANKDSCIGMENATTYVGQLRLLGVHNYVRNYMAAGNVPGWPEAANMRQLSWDTTCAEVALRWAFQCQSSRDRCRKTPDFEEVGQNWGVAMSDKEYPDGVYQVFQGWLGEILLASGKIVEKFKPSPRYDRFAALVWAETTKIGCGLVNLTHTGVGYKTYRQVIVCNYAPAGNVKGKPVWAKGDRCTKCPTGTACNPNSTYPHLCASPDDPSDELPLDIDIPSCEPCPFNFMSFVLYASTVVIITTLKIS